jgi:hypothetical protein
MVQIAGDADAREAEEDTYQRPFEQIVEERANVLYVFSRAHTSEEGAQLPFLLLSLVMTVVIYGCAIGTAIKFRGKGPPPPRPKRDGKGMGRKMGRDHR